MDHNAAESDANEYLGRVFANSAAWTEWRLQRSSKVDRIPRSLLI